MNVSECAGLPIRILLFSAAADALVPKMMLLVPVVRVEPALTPITLGDLLSGSITAAGEADLFTFAGTEGDVIAMTLVETTDWGGCCGGVNDARLTLFSPAGAQLIFHDSNLHRSNRIWIVALRS